MNAGECNVLWHCGVWKMKHNQTKNKMKQIKQDATRLAFPQREVSNRCWRCKHLGGWSHPASARENLTKDTGRHSGLKSIHSVFVVNGKDSHAELSSQHTRFHSVNQTDRHNQSHSDSNHLLVQWRRIVIPWVKPIIGLYTFTACNRFSWVTL